MACKKCCESGILEGKRREGRVLISIKIITRENIQLCLLKVEEIKLSSMTDHARGWQANVCTNFLLEVLMFLKKNIKGRR